MRRYLVVFVTTCSIQLGCTDSDFEFRKRTDGSEVAVVRRINDAWPVFVKSINADLAANVRLKDQLEVNGAKFGMQQTVEDFFDKQNQLNASLRTLVVGSYVMYINSELDTDVVLREQGRQHWRSLQEQLSNESMKIHGMSISVQKASSADSRVDFERNITSAVSTASETVQTFDYLNARVAMLVAPEDVARVMFNDRRVNDDRIALYRQNIELQRKLAELDAWRGSTSGQQLSGMQAEISSRDEKIAALQAQLNNPVDESTSLGSIEVTRDRAAGTVTVSMPGDLMFSGGSVNLRKSANATLDQVIAAIKKDHAGKRVIVRAYSDLDPTRRPESKWSDNLDLSAARARSVAKYLVQGGLPDKQVAMQAYSDTGADVELKHRAGIEIVVAAR